MLALHGLFVRGGIARGRHFDDGQVLFSPVLVAAHELESTAIYPRVLVPDELLGVMASEREYTPDLDEMVRRDADGLWFVHYLWMIGHCAALTADPTGEHLKGYLMTHKGEIERRWQAAPRDAKVVAKFEWLAEYHNRFCRETLAPDALPQCRVVMR